MVAITDLQGGTEMVAIDHATLIIQEKPETRHIIEMAMEKHGVPLKVDMLHIVRETSLPRL